MTATFNACTQPPSQPDPIHVTAGPDAAAVLAAVLTDHAGGWALPRAASAVVDVDYVLAAAGLLAVEHPGVAAGLLAGRLL